MLFTTIPLLIILGQFTFETPVRIEANWQVCSDKTGICVNGNATLHASMQ